MKTVLYSEDQPTWATPREMPRLAPGDVHVWRLDLERPTETADHVWDVLSPDEMARAERFRADDDRHCFAATRGVLRLLLSRYVGSPARYLAFEHGRQGKPALPGATGVQFNVSHSHRLALLAFSSEFALGVDVEYIRTDLALGSIAERFFSSDEIAALRALPAEAQPEAFFACWSRKEAVVKATGDGLSLPLDQFSVSLTSDQPARLLRCAAAYDISNWVLESLRPGPGYAGALVVAGPIQRVRCWQWPPQPA